MRLAQTPERVGRSDGLCALAQRRRFVMSSVNGVGGSSPIQKIIQSPIYKEVPSTGSTQSASLGDRLELSGVSHLLPSLQNNDIRTDKVQEIRSQIDAGTYDESGKLDQSLDKLLADLTD
jgi:anti-sigma28 factor (negative regulator of flagellin synthesis)